MPGATIRIGPNRIGNHGFLSRSASLGGTRTAICRRALPIWHSPIGWSGIREYDGNLPHVRKPIRPGVVITGMGAVSPLGTGVSAYIRGLREGRSGVGLWEAPEEELARCRARVVAACRDWDPRSVMEVADIKRFPRLVPMALAAAQEAVRQAGWADFIGVDDSEDPRLEGSRRIGVVLGTGAGGIDFTLDQSRIAHGPQPDGEVNPPASGSQEGIITRNKGAANPSKMLPSPPEKASNPPAAVPGGRPRSISLWTITNATHGNLAGELSIRLGLRGPSLCVSTGCASSSDAIGLAMDLLRSERPGSPEAMVVVGADAHLRWETLKGMELLGVLALGDDEPSSMARPFCATRSGFVLGEGAWAVVLEREDHCARREGTAIGRALGYGATCDAFHRVRPEPSMAECARAIGLALEDAGLLPEDVELVQYHGTATKTNDALETKAVRMAFGAHADRLRGSSIKGAIGHPQGACGLASVVAMLGAMTNADGHADGAFVPPTINLRERDAECDLEYTPGGATATDARVALVNCLAFGAKNSAVVVGRE